MARQERAIRTRQVILEAAGAVFDEHGYAATTISMVLERAAVTKGALYFHFPSKESLAQAVLDEQISFGAVPPIWSPEQRQDVQCSGMVQQAEDRCLGTTKECAGQPEAHHDDGCLGTTKACAGQPQAHHAENSCYGTMTTGACGADGREVVAARTATLSTLQLITPAINADAPIMTYVFAVAG